MPYETNSHPIYTLPGNPGAQITSYKLIYRDPQFRTWAMNAQTSILHSFKYVVFDDVEREELLKWIDSQPDIWIDAGFGKHGATGSIPICCGGYPYFEIKTPLRSIAALFKLTFGGVA